MGFGFHGKIADKFNRSLLPKRKFRTKEEVYGRKNVTRLHFKKSTFKDILKIKRKIAVYKKESLAISLLALLVTILLILVMYFLLR